MGASRSTPITQLSAAPMMTTSDTKLLSMMNWLRTRERPLAESFSRMTYTQSQPLAFSPKVSSLRRWPACEYAARRMQNEVNRACHISPFQDHVCGWLMYHPRCASESKIYRASVATAKADTKHVTTYYPEHNLLVYCGWRVFLLSCICVYLVDFFILFLAVTATMATKRGQKPG